MCGGGGWVSSAGLSADAAGAVEQVADPGVEGGAFDGGAQGVEAILGFAIALLEEKEGFFNGFAGGQEATALDGTIEEIGEFRAEGEGYRAARMVRGCGCMAPAALVKTGDRQF